MDYDFLKFVETAPASLGSLVINLLLATILSLILAWHFKRFGRTFSNRSRFAHLLPAMALSTVLVISIIKASLALSLGLVGALSIVRFRTPIKEPEELLYLFLSIGIGLGLGADQRLTTVVAVPLILSVMAIQSRFRKTSKHPNLYCNVQVPRKGMENGELQRLVETITPHVAGLDLRRFDVHNGTLQATFHTDCKDLESLVKIQENIRTQYPESTLSFVEQSGIS